MPDLGLLSLPILGAVGLFLLSLYAGDDLVIHDVRVLTSAEAPSHSETVLTRQLIDDLRLLNERAQAELTGIQLESNTLSKSLDEAEQYLNLASVLDEVRYAVGATPWHVTAELTKVREEAVFTARIYSKDAVQPVSLVEVRGSFDDLAPVIQQAAIEILARINPYIVALSYYREELEANELHFPRTREMLARSEGSLLWDSYLRNDLLGRMHRQRAERDATLGVVDQAAELRIAEKYLKAALVQNPDFLHANLSMALVHADLKEYELADRYFLRAVQINPDHPATRQLWAQALAGQDRLRDAIVQYVAAVETDPANPKLRKDLAALYAKAGDAGAALAQWRRAYELDPLDEEAAAQGASPTP